MYKFLLCLHYLRSRVIAYFAALAVALCVAMMLIVISVMNGFLDKIENAAKGLFGDVIIDSSSLDGLARYDEFIDGLAEQVPQVARTPTGRAAVSPFLQTYGILQVESLYRHPVTVVGIRLPERAFVSSIRGGLFVQNGWESPTFDPPIDQVRKRLSQEHRGTLEILNRRKAAPHPDEDLLRQLDVALYFQDRLLRALAAAEPFQKPLRELQDRLDAARRARFEPSSRPAGSTEAQIDELTGQIEDLQREAGLMAPEARMILGLGLEGLSLRTSDGETVRVIGPGQRVTVTMIPLGRSFVGAGSITPLTQAFTVVDDARTDVWSIDSGTVYVPFETLQRLNNMAAEESADQPGSIAVPARCSQLHVKVRPEYAQGQRLEEVCRKIRRAWTEFSALHPDASKGEISVETWRTRQAKVIAPIQQQRTLVVIMFGVISMVAVVLIFVIFYMIVFQKTKDIGVLKALGASSAGVAGVFLLYGAAIGLVGSILGTIGGWAFVRNINLIRDFMEKWFGFGVWSKEWFLFEQIPDTVRPETVVNVVLAAIVAGLLGALIPAIRAAGMQPVEALRYE